MSDWANAEPDGPIPACDRVRERGIRVGDIISFISDLEIGPKALIEFIGESQDTSTLKNNGKSPPRGNPKIVVQYKCLDDGFRGIRDYDDYNIQNAFVVKPYEMEDGEISPEYVGMTKEEEGVGPRESLQATKQVQGASDEFEDGELSS